MRLSVEASLSFRSGNASGADEAFTAGVIKVAPERIQIIAPYAGHRKKQRHPTGPTHQKSNTINRKAAGGAERNSHPQLAGCLPQAGENEPFVPPRHFLSSGGLLVG